MAQVQAPNEAHALLSGSFAGTYRFPEGFHGFTGAIEITESTPDGLTRTDSGQVLVAGPGNSTIEGVESPDLMEWALNEIRSVAGHRWVMTYADADGKHTLALDEEATTLLGEYVKVLDDRFDSAYRVKDGRISQVIRTMGPTTFTITIQADRAMPDGKRLPAHFTVNYWKDVRLTRSDMYHDEYAEVDGVWLPVSRQVTTADDAGFTARRLGISDISLLVEPLAPAASAAERTGTRAG
jgi:hypothetical protein